MNTSCLGRNASFQIQAGSQTKAGWASNHQEKPSGDTKTDLFLCLLQHICLGWDSGPPLSDKRQQAACAPEGFYICVRLTLPPEVPVSYPVLWLRVHHVHSFQVHTGGTNNCIEIIKSEDLLGASLVLKTTLPLHKYAHGHHSLYFRGKLRHKNKEFGSQQPSNLPAPSETS